MTEPTDDTKTRDPMRLAHGLYLYWYGIPEAAREATIRDVPKRVYGYFAEHATSADIAELSDWLQRIRQDVTGGAVGPLPDTVWIEPAHGPSTDIEAAALALAVKHAKDNAKPRDFATFVREVLVLLGEDDPGEEVLAEVAEALERAGGDEAPDYTAIARFVIANGFRPPAGAT